MSGLLPFFGTWNPAAEDSNRPESPDPHETFDDDDPEFQEESETTYSTLLAGMIPSFASFHDKAKKTSRRPGSILTQPFSRFKRPNMNGNRMFNSPRFGTTPRGAYWDEQGGTGPILESRKFAGTYVDLPKVAPLNANPDDKKLILTQTIKRIENTSVATWADRTDFVLNRYLGAVPHASGEADAILLELNQFTSAAYSFGHARGLKSDLEETPLAPSRNRIVLRYISLEMRINPTRILPDYLQVPDIPDSKVLAVVLKLPLNATETALHDCVSRDRLLHPEALIQAISDHGLRMDWGLINRSHLYDTDLFRTEFTKVKDECKFFTVKALLMRDYVGKGIVTDLEQRLQSCRQVSYRNGKRHVKRVAEHHADFMRLVQEFDTTDPIPFNLSTIEFHSLSEEIRNHLMG